MDFVPCLACSYAIVADGLSYNCGHAIHSECFDTFLELENIQCDSCASSQYNYSNGYEPEGEYVESDEPDPNYYSDSCLPMLTLISPFMLSILVFRLILKTFVNCLILVQRSRITPRRVNKVSPPPSYKHT